MPKERIVYEGRIFQIVETHHESGEVWETAVRTPGVRLIIKNNDGTYKLSSEHRHELGKRDIRLPGGKVFDTLGEYSEYLESGQDMMEAAKQTAIREAKEELGLEDIKNIKFVEKSVLGATVGWDLYVFEISDFSIGEQKTHGHEDIEPIDLRKEDILNAIEKGEFNEDRMVPVLLRYLKNK